MNREKIAAELVKLAKSLISASRYGWLIYWDETERKNVKIFGPSGLSHEFQQMLQRGEGEEFELYDADKTLYYRGRIVGDYDGFEPKDDFGESNAGCTDVKLGGRWL